jgi:hypothetical protein
MVRVRVWTRWVLLGDDNSWGARLATSRYAIAALASLAVILHALDLMTGLRMMLVYGIQLEQNPLARALMNDTGPLGLAAAKLGVVVFGVLLFVRTARAGRPRLARNCLLLAAGIGLLGFTSNMVG